MSEEYITIEYYYHKIRVIKKNFMLVCKDFEVIDNMITLNIQGISYNTFSIFCDILNNINYKLSVEKGAIILNDGLKYHPYSSNYTLCDENGNDVQTSIPIHNFLEWYIITDYFKCYVYTTKKTFYKDKIGFCMRSLVFNTFGFTDYPIQLWKNNNTGLVHNFMSHLWIYNEPIVIELISYVNEKYNTYLDTKLFHINDICFYLFRRLFTDYPDRTNIIQFLKDRIDEHFSA